MVVRAGAGAVGSVATGTKTLITDPKKGVQNVATSLSTTANNIGENVTNAKDAVVSRTKQPMFKPTPKNKAE